MTVQIPLEDMTLRQLRRVASAVGVSRYSRMRKDQLLSSILDKQGPAQTMIEASKYGLQAVSTVDLSLADVDDSFKGLPNGYGDSRIVILPRDPQWAYAYWDISNQHKEELRRQGGEQLALRLFDVTDLDLSSQSPHSVQEYGCDEMAREWYLPLPVSDREYLLEIGYRTWDGRWLKLARSESMPSQKASESTATYQAQTELHNHIFGMVGEVEAQHIAGSIHSSMQDAPSPAPHLDSVSSYVFPSGAGLWALPTFSGLNMSGIGLSSGELAKPQPRKFWLVADAELIVYGATEPDATVYVDGEPIVLNSDGTFRFQMSFQDGQLKFPIVAVAADGEQNRSIRMDFERTTSDRRTNTKAEAVEEWFATP